MNYMDDDELDRALRHWQPPAPAAQLEGKALGRYRSEFHRAPRWRRLLTMRVRAPLPALAAMVIAVLCLSAALARLELRGGPAGASRPAASEDLSKQPWGGLQPVAELRPRVIRSHDEAH